MNSFATSEVAELLGVSVATVRRWTVDGRIPAARDHRGRRVIEGAVLAKFAVAIAERPQTGRVVGASPGIRMVGIVTKVVRDTVMAQVEVQAGPHRIVSLMSREAADQLDLAPGMLAVTSAKAIDIVVEIPDSD